MCQGFRTHTKKDGGTRLKFLLMEAALHPPLKLTHANSTLSTSASLRSAAASQRGHAVLLLWHQQKTLLLPRTPGGEGDHSCMGLLALLSIAGAEKEAVGN